MLEGQERVRVTQTAIPGCRCSIMRTTLRLFEGHVHKPLIRFLGKRVPTSSKLSLSGNIPISAKISERHIPHPHPAAPPDVASHFSEFRNKFSSSVQSSPSPQSFSEFWDAPSRFWAPSRAVDETEIEAVLVILIRVSSMRSRTEENLVERWRFT